MAQAHQVQEQALTINMPRGQMTPTKATTNSKGDGQRETAAGLITVNY